MSYSSRITIQKRIWKTERFMIFLTRSQGEPRPSGRFKTGSALHLKAVFGKPKKLTDELYDARGPVFPPQKDADHSNQHSA